MSEKDTHRKLLEALRDYVKINMVWEAKETHTAGVEARRILSEIRRLAIKRRDEIQQVRLKKPKIKSPSYKPNLGKDDTDDS
jgi:hypothetical protein